MKPNIFNRYYCDKQGNIYDTLDNNKRQRTRIRQQDRHRAVYLWAAGKKKTERRVSRLVASIYLPNPDNHFHLYVKEPERIDLSTMRWVSLSELRILNAGGVVERKEKKQHVKVNGVYPQKTRPSVTLNAAANFKWR